MKTSALFGVLALILLAAFGSWVVLYEDDLVARCNDVARRQSETSNRLNMLKVRQQVLSSERRILARLERLAPQTGRGMSSPGLAAMANYNERLLAETQAQGTEMQRVIDEVCDEATRQRRSSLLMQLIFTTMAAAAGFWVGSAKNG